MPYVLQLDRRETRNIESLKKNCCKIMLSLYFILHLCNISVVLRIASARKRLSNFWYMYNMLIPLSSVWLLITFRDWKWHSFERVLLQTFAASASFVEPLIFCLWLLESVESALDISIFNIAFISTWFLCDFWSEPSLHDMILFLYN